MKRTSILATLALLSLVLMALACNLTGGPPPPTVVPSIRATETPLPTIAYATLPPEQLPQQNVQPQNPVIPSGASDVRSQLAQVQPDRLMMHVDSLQRMVTRHVNSPDTGSTGVAAAYRYIRSQFENIAAQSSGRFSVLEHSFELEWEGVKTTQRNVVGYLQGDGIGAGVIVVGAHYDSITRNPADAIYNAPGADDNASGVAGLIELARVLSQRPRRATIMFVAFAAEEVGREGSRAFVRFLRERNVTVDAMYNMDIIGSGIGPNGEVDAENLRLFSAGPETSPSRQLARSIYWINYNHMPDMKILVQDSEDRQGRYSDHMSFTEAGFPAVRFIEALEAVTRQHTPNDTIDYIQASYLLRSTQSVLASLIVMSTGLPPPTNIIIRNNGTPTRTLVWEPIEGAVGYLIGLRAPGSLIINQQFPWNNNSVDWDGFNASLFTSVVISAVDSNGLMGPPSREIPIP